jgi:hypothetical protein
MGKGSVLKHKNAPQKMRLKGAKTRKIAEDIGGIAASVLLR